MTPRRSPRRKIDWAALQFALAVFMLIVGAAMAYAYLSGGTAEKLNALDRRVDVLEQQLRELRRGAGVDEGARSAR